MAKAATATELKDKVEQSVAESQQERQKTPGELLATSFHEMLTGYRQIFARTGEIEIKEIIERAETALKANQ